MAHNTAIVIVQWYHIIPWHTGVKKIARMGALSEITQGFSALFCMAHFIIIDSAIEADWDSMTSIIRTGSWS